MWGPGASGGFQNALMMGIQAGQAVRQGVADAQAMRERRDYRNALQQFDPSNPETLQPIMAVNPEVGLRLGERVDARRAAQTQAGIEGLEQFRPLLEQAVQSPEQWAVAYQSGVNSGLDMSRVPQQYDPEWAKGQLMFLEAAKDPEKVGRIGEAMRAFGYTDPSQPGYDQALQEFTRMTFARESTDAQGRPILVFPEVAPAAGAAQPVVRQQASGVSEANLPAITSEQWQANVQSMGLSRAIRWATNNGIPIPVATPQEATALPEGALYSTPDGRIIRR